VALLCLRHALFLLCVLPVTFALNALSLRTKCHVQGSDVNTGAIFREALIRFDALNGGPRYTWHVEQEVSGLLWCLSRYALLDLL